MTTYKQIFGKQVKNFSSDPSSVQLEGQIWFNTTSGTFKTLLNTDAWSSGGGLTTARREAGTTGTQTAGLVFGGGNPDTTATEEYNGSSFTNGGNLNTAREGLGRAGTQTAALGFGGANYGSPPIGTTNKSEEYNGSSWTNVNNMNNSRTYLSGFGATQTAAIAVGGNPPTATTESYDGTNWTNLSAPSNVPSIRFTTASAGTQTAGLIFGGALVSGGNAIATSSDWNGSAWTNTATLNTARRRLGGAGTSTDALGFGGYAPNPAFSETEKYDGTTWSISTATLATTIRPGGNNGTGTGSAALTAGGQTPSAIVDTTQEYNQSLFLNPEGTWAASTNLPGARNNCSVSQSGTVNAAYAAGGSNGGAPYAPDTPTVEYDGSSWTAGGALSTGRLSAGSGGTLTAGLTWGGFLGPGSGTNTNTTEEYNGTSWTGGGNLPGPQRECYGDGTQTDSIFGGSFGQPNVTAAKYDGSSWTAISNLPAGRFAGSGAGNSSAFVLAGGFPSAVTLEWNGSSWAATGNNIPNSPVYALAAGGVQTSALFYGGDTGTLTASTFFYDGTAFTTRANMAQSQSTDNSGSSGSCLAIGGGSPAVTVEEYTDGTASPLFNIRTLTTS